MSLSQLQALEAAQGTAQEEVAVLRSALEEAAKHADLAEGRLREETTRREHMETATQEAIEAHRVKVEAIDKINIARLAAEGEA